jgi:mannose-1-phosphate guanylyltransferase/mannose-6-phosphate isomerase
VAVVGVKNLIIVETPDAVLIADRNQDQHIKVLVEGLVEDQREEQLFHRKVNRPWGWYDSIDAGENFKVKRIYVKPGASLSLQKHQSRAEHWVVVKGIAEITNGEKTITLKENESTFIPQGQLHRLRNSTNLPLEIIEVQSGEYLGENDIIRYDDTYGRGKEYE